MPYKGYDSAHTKGAWVHNVPAPVTFVPDMHALTQTMDNLGEDFLIFNDRAACITDEDFSFSSSPSPTPRFSTPSPYSEDNIELAQVFDNSALREPPATAIEPVYPSSSEPQRACRQALRAISMDDPFATVKKRWVAAIFDAQGVVSIDEIACLGLQAPRLSTSSPRRPQPSKLQHHPWTSTRQHQ